MSKGEIAEAYEDLKGEKWKETQIIYEKVNMRIPKDIRHLRAFCLLHLCFSGQIMYSPDMEVSLH